MAPFRLPGWLDRLLDDRPERYANDEEKMSLAIRISEMNLQEQSGGPFGAVVFEMNTGKLVAPGMNLVVPESCSAAHAEIVALTLAQKAVGTFDLGAASSDGYELVTSAQPCIMCFGAIWWSGVSRLVIGARKEDVERLTGFEEGPVPPNWIELLEGRRAPLRPVQVTRDVLSDRACAVLRRYEERGGPIYNPS